MARELPSRKSRMDHIETRLMEHAQDIMGMVLATEDELVVDIDRLRSERDLAREEVAILRADTVRLRSERDTAASELRKESAARVSREESLGQEISRLSTEVTRVLEELETSRRDVKRSKDFMHLAEEARDAALIERRRLEEDCNVLRVRNERLMDKLRTMMATQTPRKAPAQHSARDYSRRSSSERDTSNSFAPYGLSHSSSSYAHQGPSSPRQSAHPNNPRTHLPAAADSAALARRAGSPRQGEAWYPPSPRKTTSQPSPHQNRMSPPFPTHNTTSSRPTYTHVRTSGIITAVVPVKEEDEDTPEALLGRSSVPSGSRSRQRATERPRTISGGTRGRSARARVDEAEFVAPDDIDENMSDDYEPRGRRGRYRERPEDDDDELAGWQEDKSEEDFVVERGNGVARTAGQKRKAAPTVDKNSAAKRKLKR